MAIHQLRSSQLITTFGTGALVDLPHVSVIIGGPDNWEYKEDEIADHIIREPRLSKRIAEYLNELFQYNLHDVQLMRPPVMQSFQFSGGKRPQVAAFKFPEWYVVQKIEDHEGGKRRRLITKRHIDGNRYRDPQGNKHTVVPIRFVRACDKGHVDDVDWLTFVHGAENRNCLRAQGGMYLQESGSSGSLVDIEVVCDCGKRRSLAMARKDPSSLGRCSRRRPWLGPFSRDESCTLPSKLLVRNASNAYFSQLYSIISIPDSSGALETVLKRFDADFAEVHSEVEVEMLRKFNSSVKLSLESCGSPSNKEVYQALEKLRGNGDEQIASSKPLEFAAFVGPSSKLSKDKADAHFFIRPLADELWKSDPLLARVFERIVLVERLREVVAQVGFTRFESPGKKMDGELDLELNVQPAPLAKDKTNLVPAFENRGEGFFLNFSPSEIEAWAQKPAVQDRAQELRAGFELKMAERKGDGPEFFGTPFYLLHTFAHLLIQEVALVCGYPTSSLKERIYCDPAKQQYGILIYTGSPDAEGTLGGLVNSAQRIQAMIRNTVSNASICSSDPVCAFTKPEENNPSRWLLGSACHCCTHLPETSCEQMNQMLDRSLVVPTLQGLGCEFFSLNDINS